VIDGAGTSPAAGANGLFMRITLTRSILGAGFAEYGSADAIHLGPPAEAALVVGVDNVARLVAGQDPLNTPAMISSGPDRSIVASSGGFGVTIGLIRPDGPSAGQPAAFPFLTIWRRPGVDASWRFIAE
jgi:hypothetical protein